VTIRALHPDHLQPGDSVGVWRIVQVLGRGGSARVFKVERDGLFYAMKTALRPLSGHQESLSEEEYAEGVSAYRRLAREAAALFTYASHPNLLRVHAVDFWPNLDKGYGYLVTDYVDGDNWHQARWRQPFHAARLVDTFSDVVRTVGVLHERGVYHRDLKAENILIRREDGRPFLIDFGTVRLPGALTQTMGLPEGVLHLLPPELLAYTRTEGWKRGIPFQGVVSADLYALGVLLYQALTDLHPFDPELPDKELLAAIADVPPTPPHLLNPRVPRSLSDIALRLLEKQPEARYPNTGALLEALGRAAEKERHLPAWRVPLTTPEERFVDERSGPSSETVLPESPLPPAGESREGASSGRGLRGRRTWRLVLAGLLLGTMGWLIWRATLPSTLELVSVASTPAQIGTQSVPQLPRESTLPSRRALLPSILTVGLCAVSSIGCPAAQVRPDSDVCPEEAQRSMFEVLKLTPDMRLDAILDIKQPGEAGELGTYRAGLIVGRVVQDRWSAPELPGGTLLRGRLWTGPGIRTPRGTEAVIGRYTEAVLPDGRELPVCIVIGGPGGRWDMRDGSQPGGEVRLERLVGLTVVRSWP
jgi:eukaryotic-like serine/threonine-protein kinase